MEETLQNILVELRRQNARDRLWSVSDIATYTAYSSNYVMNKLVNLPDFPKPVRLIEGGERRWLPDDVKRFALKRKEKH